MMKTLDQRFIDRFDTFEVIGSGKFATVRRCVERETNNEFAAKFIRKRSSTGRMGQTVDDINREIDLLRQINHKNIIKLYDVFDCGNEVIIVLELVKGGELFDLISEKGVLAEDEAIHYIRQILMAIKHLHDKSIVHLDLKPENILLRDKTTKQIKLIDFGISRKIINDCEVKGLYGTPEFVAPEIINYESVNTGTDMWAIGCISYILLSGASPFLGDTKQETFVNITAVDYQFDDQYFADISQLAKDFISGLLIKNSKKRLSVDDCLNHKWIQLSSMGYQQNHSIDIDIDKFITCNNNINNHHNHCHNVTNNEFINTIARNHWKRAIGSVIICYRLVKKFKENLSQHKLSSTTIESPEHRYSDIFETFFVWYY
ncbi:death-associated protein kinase 2-like [Oppia nitens]|uniref:death-associated protein kinase 2-like n=1 Tax=Oppia nitens TaxID=1686743 RepID=UPI0023DB9447|nr:death-associated protein kinase 2-like [Oppia nitens]